MLLNPLCICIYFYARVHNCISVSVFYSVIYRIVSGIVCLFERLFLTTSLSIFTSLSVPDLDLDHTTCPGEKYSGCSSTSTSFVSLGIQQLGRIHTFRS